MLITLNVLLGFNQLKLLKLKPTTFLTVFFHLLRKMIVNSSLHTVTGVFTYGWLGFWSGLILDGATLVSHELTGLHVHHNVAVGPTKSEFLTLFSL